MCCPSCFKDDFLADFVRRSANDTGLCQFCGTAGTVIAPADLLAPYFEGVLDAYVPRNLGVPLWELWSRDWDIFSTGANARQIVETVLGAAAVPAYVARGHSYAASELAWSRLRAELQTENRFFPANAPDRELFGALIANLAVTDLPAIFYRARVLRDEYVYALGEMGAPPAHLASDGRANPFGIRYLYLADDVGTAIAEVKPSKAARVAVAGFRVRNGAGSRLIDLSEHPRVMISPFRTMSSVSQVLSSMSFLVALGQELSVPTQPHRATLDYLASQYLCELIKVCGYDGVIYRSSLGEGRNYAFFDVAKCESFEPVETYDVSDIRVDFRRTAVD